MLNYFIYKIKIKYVALKDNSIYLFHYVKIKEKKKFLQIRLYISHS